MTEFWSACLLKFEEQLPLQQLNTWIKPLRAGGFRDEETSKIVEIIAPSRFVQRWVRDHYLKKIEEIATEFFAESVRVEVIVGSPTIEKITVEVEEKTGGTEKSDIKSSKPEVDTTPPSQFRQHALNKDYLFSSLVTGKANNFARAAAQQVAMNPGQSYNPLFIYGGVGLGKTHLVQAIGNQVLQDNPDAIVRYIHAEDYVSDVVKAYQQRSFEQFKSYYRSLDVLLVDDIQFFTGKSRTQEEFFYIFNTLVSTKKQIVIACDTYPKEIQGLDERLISRLDWGLTVHIEPPELEMRVAILKLKAESMKFDLADDVAFLIANNLKGNVRELEGALNRITAYRGFTGSKINIEFAKEALKDVIGTTNRNLTLEKIQRTVADFYKIKISEMNSPKRTRTITRPRQIAMWLCRDLTNHSLPEIGDAFGGRDHTTVIHACRTIEEMRIEDERMAREINILLQTLRA